MLELWISEYEQKAPENWNGSVAIYGAHSHMLNNEEERKNIVKHLHWESLILC